MAEVLQLHPSQKKKAAQVLAAAFFDYPVFQFYFPDGKRRTRYLPWYMECVLNCALRYGEVFTTPDVGGVLFVLPPGRTKITTGEYIQNGYLLTPFVMGFAKHKQVMECEDYLQQSHESIMQGRPHYYLWGLVVDPSVQKSGIGTALMTRLLAKADAEQQPIYLETHKEQNVRYYQRLGFRLARTDSIPKHGLEFWCMVREPVNE